MFSICNIFDHLTVTTQEALHRKQTWGTQIVRETRHKYKLHWSRRWSVWILSMTFETSGVKLAASLACCYAVYFKPRLVQLPSIFQFLCIMHVLVACSFRLREHIIRMANLVYMPREQFIMQKFNYYRVIPVQQRTKLNNLAAEEGKSYFEP